MGNVKTSFILPRDLYSELKKRAAEEGRTVKEIVIEAILSYLSSSGKKSRIKELILKPSEGAGPEDMREFRGEDVD
ncbi:conserved hypothetical protein [Ferroglobus placidus DSM 10642]|uniref:Ribbon-helix-helix protein CopG domain-containing protein n=1 Tax=Ferroglobus placidus (strain DSM 10642 / AEDII12DO) TaxID=589924 RepID=D3RZN9_FERPA|nr:hypothetical protein [Ferroglobus placidus]ADC65952.1 conserved hypothetical protein [Ferroglobus placidus DSM 10642]